MANPNLGSCWTLPNHLSRRRKRFLEFVKSSGFNFLFWRSSCSYLVRHIWSSCWHVDHHNDPDSWSIDGSRFHCDSSGWNVEKRLWSWFRDITFYLRKHVINNLLACLQSSHHELIIRSRIRRSNHLFDSFPDDQTYSVVSHLSIFYQIKWL